MVVIRRALLFSGPGSGSLRRAAVCAAGQTVFRPVCRLPPEPLGPPADEAHGGHRRQREMPQAAQTHGEAAFSAEQNRWGLCGRGAVIWIRPPLSGQTERRSSRIWPNRENGSRSAWRCPTRMISCATTTFAWRPPFPFDHKSTNGRFSVGTVRLSALREIYSTDLSPGQKLMFFTVER